VTELFVWFLKAIAIIAAFFGVTFLGLEAPFLFWPLAAFSVFYALGYSRAQVIAKVRRESK
jgi:hypothetical protein